MSVSALREQAIAIGTLEAALEALDDEERRGAPYSAGRLVQHLAITLSALVGAFAFPLGALLRFVEPRLGQPLLVAGLAALAALTLLNTLGREGPVLAVAALAAAAEPVEARAGAASQRRWRLLGRVGLGIGALYLVAGLVWLLYSLFALRQANGLALALVGSALLCVFALTAQHGYREYRYYAGVSGLRRRLSAQYVEARRAELAQVTLAAADAAGLDHIQRRRLKRRLMAALRRLPSETEGLYAVAWRPEALAAVRALSIEAQAAIHARLAALQAEGVAEAAPVVRVGEQLLSVAVEAERRLVTVARVEAAVEAIGER